MPTPLNIGTRDIPLKLAEAITARVKAEWENGTILEKVSSTTRDLLTFKEIVKVEPSHFTMR